MPDEEEEESGIEIKPDPDATPAPDLSNEDEEVNIKDWKPDIDVTYKGEHRRRLWLAMPGHR